MKVYRDNETNPSLLKDKSIAVVGFGNQGSAFAFNLRDSGLDVSVALNKESKTIQAVAEHDFPIIENTCVANCEIILLLIPDHLQSEYYGLHLDRRLRKGQTIVFAHGLSVAFKQIVPPAGVFCSLVAPHGPGTDLRSRYLDGTGLSCFVASHPVGSRKGLAIAVAIAGACGCTKAGAFKTTFRDEAIGDLFGEQSLLCGGLIYLTSVAFNTLIENGLPPENAYLETVHQIDLLANLLKRYGAAGMLERISKTAAIGTLKMQELLSDQTVKTAFDKALRDIESGEFTGDWTQNDDALQQLNSFIEVMRKSDLDKTGKKLRRIIGDD